VNGKLTTKIDIWAFGCVLLQFATGKAPYNKVVGDLALSKIIDGGTSPLEYMLEHNKMSCGLLYHHEAFY